MLDNRNNFVTFEILEEAETGTAGVQPVRNILVNGNNNESSENCSRFYPIISVKYALKNSINIYS